VFLICTVLVIFLLIYIVLFMEKITSYIIIFAFGFCIYNIYPYFFFRFWFLCLLAGVFNLYSTGFFFSSIIIVVNLYGTPHGKSN
jgi:hypothetical protein